MIEAGKAPATVRYARAVLRVALRQAVRWGLIARNPVYLVDGPRVETHEIQPFDLVQAQAFLAAVVNDRLEALWSVALSLGLRQGEALGLRWDDIKLEKAELLVRHQLQRVDRKLVLVPTKTKRGARKLSLPSSIVASLRAHRDRQERQIGALPGPSAFVFTTRLGRRWRRATSCGALRPSW
jgi:integrase